jgi:dUTP pyrophosphatase
MKITKIRNVKTPEYGTDGSAGIDFFIPDDFETRVVRSKSDILIPSGIKAEVPEGYALIAFNKSGIAVNKHLCVGACVVDSDYRGEIHLHVFNYCEKDIKIKPGEKLVQFLLLPYQHTTITEVPTFEIDNQSTTRGTGGFGSTNKKENEDV